MAKVHHPRLYQLVAMPAAEHRTCPRVDIWTAPVVHSEPLNLDVLSQLTDTEIQRCRTFRDPMARAEFISSRNLLHFASKAMKRPFGSSLSHAGGAVAVAVSPTGSVGVDLEPVAEACRVPIGGIFTRKEEKRLTILPPKKRRLAALALWTRKEAVTKLEGYGHHMDFASFELSGWITGNPHCFVNTLVIKVDNRPFMLSYAVRGADGPFHQTRI